MPSKKSGHNVGRNITLKKSRKGNPNEQGRASGFQISPKVFQKSKQKIRVAIAVSGFTQACTCKTGKVK
jgi:hypothetical protein